MKLKKMLGGTAAGLAIATGLGPYSIVNAAVVRSSPSQSVTDLSPTLPMGSDVPEPAVSSISLEDPNLQKAINLWNSSKQCDPDYFDMTLENLRRSNVDSWYKRWIEIEGGNNLAEYEREGEVRFFAKRSFNGFYIECNIQNNGCNDFKSPENIVTYTLTQKGNENMSMEEVMDLSRKRWFVQRKIEAITRSLAWAHTLQDIISLDVAQRIPLMVETFSPQTDPRVDAMCLLYKQAFDTTMAFIQAASNTFAGPYTTFGPKDVKGTQRTKFGDGDGIFNLGTFISTTFAQVKEWAVLAAKYKEIIQDSHGDQDFGFAHLPPQTYARGWCPGIGAGIKPNNFDRAAKLSDYLARNSAQIRFGLMDMMHGLTAGYTEDGKVISYLSLLMSQAPWSGQQNAAQIIETARKQLEESLISALMANSKCFVHCTKRDNADDQKCRDDSYASGHKFRKCIDGYACQVGCWPSVISGGHLNSLIGHKKLKDWDLTLDGVISSSYVNYKRHGIFDPDTTVASLTQVVANPNSNDSFMALPLCTSKENPLGDIKEGMNNMHLTYRPERKRLPCDCGTMSNETKPFFKMIGLALGQADMNSKLSAETMQYICPGNLQETYKHYNRPLNRYLDFCNIGVRFPHGGATVDIGRIDDSCGIIRNHTSTMPEIEANTWFCNSELAKKLFKSESPSAVAVGYDELVESHKTMCEKFTKSHTADLVAGLDADPV